MEEAFLTVKTQDLSHDELRRHCYRPLKYPKKLYLNELTYFVRQNRQSNFSAMWLPFG